MRTLGGFGFALLLASGLMAQGRSGFVTPMPGSRPSFGSVVFPGGFGLPGVQRSTGSVLHPGGSFPQIGIPGVPFQTINGQLRGQMPGRGIRRSGVNGTGFAYPVAVPVYVGGYDPSMYYGAPAEPAPAQQQPNVIVVYPPAPAAPAYSYMAPAQPNMVDTQPEPAAQQPSPQQEPPTAALLAFKDHSIYSVVAYWVDGETLHYFTAPNVHKQSALSQVDRELTQRLNEGTSHEVKLPPAK